MSEQRKKRMLKPYKTRVGCRLPPMSIAETKERYKKRGTAKPSYGGGHLIVRAEDSGKTHNDTSQKISLTVKIARDDDEYTDYSAVICKVVRGERKKSGEESKNTDGETKRTDSSATDNIQRKMNAITSSGLQQEFSVPSIEFESKISKFRTPDKAESSAPSIDFEPKMSKSPTPDKAESVGSTETVVSWIDDDIDKDIAPPRKKSRKNREENKCHVERYLDTLDAFDKFENFSLVSGKLSSSSKNLVMEKWMTAADVKNVKTSSSDCESTTTVERKTSIVYCPEPALHGESAGQNDVDVLTSHITPSKSSSRARGSISHERDAPR